MLLMGGLQGVSRISGQNTLFFSTTGALLSSAALSPSLILSEAVSFLVCSFLNQSQP